MKDGQIKTGAPCCSGRLAKYNHVIKFILTCIYVNELLEYIYNFNLKTEASEDRRRVGAATRGIIY